MGFEVAAEAQALVPSRLDDAERLKVAGGLAYRVDGEGPAALLLHPAFMHGGAFDGEVAALSDRLRLIRVDLPGHGATARLPTPPTFEGLAGRLVAVLDAEGVAAAHLLGVSLGSLVGQDLARRAPDRARSLTALGGYEVTDRTMQRAQVGAIFGLLPRLLFAPRAFAGHVAQLSATTATAQARITELAADFRLRHLLQMRGQEELGDTNRTDTLRCPLMIAVGEHDLPLAHDAARRWHTKTPGSWFVELPSAGHCANLDDGASFQAMWIAFVQAIEAERLDAP
jgi:pimeloyl-ACP methyl ester carboxylesterase